MDRQRLQTVPVIGRGYTLTVLTFLNADWGEGEHHNNAAHSLLPALRATFLGCGQQRFASLLSPRSEEDIIRSVSYIPTSPENLGRLGCVWALAERAIALTGLKGYLILPDLGAKQLSSVASSPTPSRAGQPAGSYGRNHP
jgi:hypothetical protein